MIDTYRTDLRTASHSSHHIHEVVVTTDGACVFVSGENMITHRINAHFASILSVGFLRELASWEWLFLRLYNESRSNPDFKHKQKQGLYQSQSKFDICDKHIELPAKQLDYFLRSNKSNINQKPSQNVAILNL